MNTTSLFAEIFVIGTGAAMVVVAWTWATLGADALPLEPGANGMFLFLVPLVYLLGLIVDRVSDMSLSWSERLHGRRVYSALIKSGQTWPAVFHADHRLVRMKSEELTQVLNYARSRIRICRGWVVNGSMIAGGVAVAVTKARIEPNVGVAALGAAIGVSLLCLVIYQVDAHEYAAKVHRQAAWLRGVNA